MPSMQVDQTGEAILFNVADGFVEAHIQIAYDGGDASQFAWIVPVLAVPEIEVGSFRFLKNALDASVPVYGYQSSFVCTDDGSASNSSVGFIQDPDGGGATGDPHVIAQDTAGSFEYAILQGGTSDSIGQWLADNGYAADDEAPDILDTYIDEGHVFVAFKLRNGAGIEDIHPVVVRYEGDEPCIPIRLTRIAAKDDMDIRALFLGESRVMPSNWRHVKLNRVRLDWVALGANYAELVAMAVDEPEADGRAWVTEYAGTSSIVATLDLETGLYAADAYTLAPVTEVIDILEGQQLASCDDSGCVWYHELVPSLLHEFVPVPRGVDENEFYACLECYAADIDASAWDGSAFAAAFTERIVAPMDHARSLLESWPYLTRLYTRISPYEMISDPTFVEQDGLPDEPNRLGAQREVDCCGGSMQLPGGRVIELADSNTWPTWTDDMPWAERIEEMQPAGPPATIVDRSAEIDTLVDAHNASIDCDGGTSGTETGTNGDSGSASQDAGNVEVGGDDSVGSEAGTSGGGSSADANTTGCGCAQRERNVGLGALVLFAALGLRRRR
jgi:hypothetical protein